MKNITILGSTGSIGTQTLEVVREQKDIKVVALSAKSNIDLLEKQIREFSPEIVAVWDMEKSAQLQQRVADLGVKVVSGISGLIQISTLAKVDTVVTAVVGMIGLRPTVAAIEAGKNIALANKETLVTAGHIIMPLAKEKNVSIIPVDSEHSAIFQCLQGNDEKDIYKLYLTASGGPFRGKTKEELKEVTIADALAHPNWEMGKKISIDSATMMNKGLEVIEAKWLFDVDMKQIQVVVQPQSIIHSMVEYEDGAIMAQMGTADMKLPIQYALTYPERRFIPGDRLDMKRLSSITFEEPDMETFTGLEMAYVASEIGGSMPTVYNAANEKAVAMFLDEKIAFLQIMEIVETCMRDHNAITNPTLEEILLIEKAVYKFIESRW